MKLKQSPDDFRVEEWTDVCPGSEGDFAFYRLTKQGWATPDALQAIRRRWKVDHRRMSCGGLKDRHATTLQYLTILHGPQRSLQHHGITVDYLGQVLHPYKSQDIRANFFVLTVRDVSKVEATSAEQAAIQMAEVGVPNYFDDQRFGSVTEDKQFVAKEMILGQFETALKLALVAPYAHDDKQAKQEKAILQEYWGRWSECKDRLPRGHARSLIDYLRQHPDDFKGTIARLRPELQGLYLSAYQSHLWNRLLATWITEHTTTDQRQWIQLKTDRLPIPTSLEEPAKAEWKQLQLPLPSARLKLDPDSIMKQWLDRLLEPEGFTLQEMKIKGLQKPFFSRGERAASILPEQLQYRLENDDRHPGKAKLILQFALPRGCYATMIVKRLLQTQSTEPVRSM